MRTTDETYNYALPRIPLKTTQEDEIALNKTRRALNDIHNTLVKHANKLLHELDNNGRYKQALKEYGRAKQQLEKKHSKKIEKELNKRKSDAARQMNEIRASIGLTEYDLQAWINEKRKRKYPKVLNADACQKEATRVWKGVEKIIFGDGETIHYRRWDDFHTIGSKKASSNIIPVRDEDDNVIAVKFAGRVIPFRRSLNDYETTALESDIRYAEIEFLLFPDGYHYYVNFSLKGRVPLRYERGAGPCGLDPGTSTMAFVNDTECAQVLLAPESESYDEKIAELSGRIDDSLRATNLERFNEDGTYKKRPGEEYHWVISDHCRRLKRERKMMHRKKAETKTLSHRNLARRILENCDRIATEEMDWTALAKRAKLEKDESGRYRKRKRWGKSIGSHAPGEFMSFLMWKSELLGVDFRFVDKWKFRASQLNHVTGELSKMPLSQRWKNIDGHQVQRDLYAAFLQKHAQQDGLMPDLTACTADFDAFLAHQDEFIVDACVSDAPRNSCFGF